MTAPKFVATILFLASLVVNGQTRSGNTQAQGPSHPRKQVSRVLFPVISPYGSLVALKDAKGKNILKRSSAPWREGYAVAYQVRNDSGAYEDRSLFVGGGQIKKDVLTIAKDKSTRGRKVVATFDKALQIERSFEWDKATQRLKSELIITNTTSDILRLSAIEVFMEGQMAARLINPRGDLPDPGCPINFGICAPDPSGYAGTGGTVAEDLPGCPCVYPRTCHPGQARSLWRNPSDPRSLYEDDPMGPIMPNVNNPVLSFSWTKSNLPQSTLEPGKQIVVRSWIAVPGR